MVHRQPVRKTPSADAAASKELAQDTAADAMTRLACAQFECCLHAFDSLFRAAESMRGIQLEAARAARRTHEAALARLADRDHAPDLMGIASELARFDTDTSMRYWQSLGEAMTRLHAEMLESGTRDFAALTDRFVAACNAAAPQDAAGNPVLNPDFAALIARLTTPPAADKSAGAAGAKQAADAATEAWQRWFKMSEDWTRMALQPKSAAEATSH